MPEEPTEFTLFTEALNVSNLTEAEALGQVKAAA